MPRTVARNFRCQELVTGATSCKKSVMSPAFLVRTKRSFSSATLYRCISSLRARFAKQVKNKVGYAPTKVEVETCGQGTARGAWVCKIHTYGTLSSNLKVWFSQSPNDGMWYIAAWKVEP
jgi:hypothetical protein